MKKLQIGVYTIAKNEEKFAERWAASCKDADCRFVLDTGSTDDTIAVLRGHGVTVNSAVVKPWRFDRARDTSMILLPAHLDVVIALDMDEVLGEGWRQALEAAWVPGTTRLRYPYVWSWVNGKPDVTYYAEKITGRHTHRWKHPVHEVLKPTVPEVVSWCHDLNIYHFADDNKSRSQYLPLLELATLEDPDDDRNAFYYGRELFNSGEYDKAIEQLNKHLELPRAKWNMERAASYHFLSACYEAKNDMQAALNYAYLSTMECPNSREWWIELARLQIRLQDWHGSISAVLKALNFVNRDISYLSSRYAWEEGPFDLLSIAYYNLGQRDRAFEYAKMAFDLNPADKRLKSNLDMIVGEMV